MESRERNLYLFTKKEKKSKSYCSKENHHATGFSEAEHAYSQKMHRQSVMKKTW